MANAAKRMKEKKELQARRKTQPVSKDESVSLITFSTPRKVSVSKQLLIVYNICTINRVTLNTAALIRWDSDINTLLSQNMENLNIVVVDCRGHNEMPWRSEKQFTDWIDKLKQCGLYYIAIKQYLPMRLSVNYAIKKIIELNGKYEYYMYWSSGLSISTDDMLLINIYNFLKNNENVGRASLTASDDNSPPIESGKIQCENGYIVKAGFHINEHCSIYSNEWYESFDGCIAPDIFVGNGAEPLFSYMGASIGKHVIVFSDTFVPPLSHHKSFDSAKNPGLRTAPTRWYIKSIGNTVEETEYLTAADIKGKSDRCNPYNIFLNEHGGIVGNTWITEDQMAKLNSMYGSDNLTTLSSSQYSTLSHSIMSSNSMTQMQREELNKIIKEEFFIPNFDYDTIKAEMFNFNIGEG